MTSIKPVGERETSVESYSLRNMYLTVIVVNLLHFSTGMTIVWTSPVIPELKNSLELVTLQVAAITSSWSCGAVLGPVLGTLLISSYGFKSMIWLHVVLSLVSLMLLALSSSVFCMCLGRLLSGIAGSAVLCHSPVYITQVTEPEVGALYAALCGPVRTLGYLLVYCLGTRLHYYQLLFLFVPAPVVCLACQAWMPESPLFLVSKGRFSQALQTVNFLRRGISSHAADLIVQHTQKVVSEQQSEVSDWFSQLSHLMVQRALALALALATLEQLSGSTLVLMSLHSLLDRCRLHSAIGLAASIFLAAVLGPRILSGLGLKKILIGASLGLALSSLALGGVMLLPGTADYSVFTFFCVLLYLVFYQTGFGNCREQVADKLFSRGCEVLAKSCVFSGSGFFSFLVIYLYFPLEEAFNTTTMMWVFSASSVTVAVFIALCLPELDSESG